MDKWKILHLDNGAYLIVNCHCDNYFRKRIVMIGLTAEADPLLKTSTRSTAVRGKIVPIVIAVIADLSLFFNVI